MIVNCKGCGAKFHVDPKKIRTHGSKARCSNCGEVFRVFRPDNLPETTVPKIDTEFDVLFGPLNEKSHTDTLSMELLKGKNKFPDLGKKEGAPDADLTSPLSESGGRDGEPGGGEDGALREGEIDKDSVHETKLPVKKTPLPVRLDGSDDEKGGDVADHPDDSAGFDWNNLDLGEQLGHQPGNETADATATTRDGGDAREGANSELNPHRHPHTGGTHTPPPLETDFDGAVENGSRFGHDPERLQDRELYRSWQSQEEDGERSGYAYTFEDPIAAPLGDVTARRFGMTYRYRESRVGVHVKGALRFLFIFLAAFGLVIAAMYIASVYRLVPKGSSEKVMRMLNTLLSGNMMEGGERAGVTIAEDSGIWLQTANGYVFVVSGYVVNHSPYVVNYVKVASEYISGGQHLYSTVSYAGNTFNEHELRTFSLDEIEARLNRRNGDVDFRNVDKLSGLNYGIQSGESVPFFAVFPSKRKVLGLRYRVRVAGFERGPKVVEGEGS